MSERDDERERKRERERQDDRARRAALEDELEVARHTIADLERADEDAREPRSGGGHRELRDASYDPTASARRWLGAPALLRLSRRFEGKLPEERFEQLVERAREITHEPGIVELKPNSLVWGSSPGRHATQSHLMVRVTVARNDDGEWRTDLTVTDRLGALVGRLFGAIGSVVGAGGLAVPVAASIVFPAFAPAFALGWLGGVYGTTRVLYKKLAIGRAKRLHELFGALVLEVEPYVA